MAGTITIEVTPEEISLLASALDSHVYWQLSEPEYRNSGYVLDPGSDDPEGSAEIKRAEALQERIEALIPPEMRVG